MFKLESFSLKKRMQIVAIMGIASMILLLVLFWYMDSSGVSAEDQLWIAIAFAVVDSAILYIVATYVANYGAVHEANMMVAGIQNIKRVI